MKKILMRAQIEHDKAFSPHDVLISNLMGGNIGNWLYQYSLYRALMIDENVQIDIIDTKKYKPDKKYISMVNETYDVFILPLANAFKASFTSEFKDLIKFISGLKIPCILIGVGIQCKLGKDFNSSYADRELAYEFIKTVLDRSSMIGVRGEATGDFLKSLGFREEVDYTVIGCPSMYMCGMHLPKPKPFSLDRDKLFSYNSKVEHENDKIIRFLSSMTKEHENYIYVPQRLGDMLRCYYGIDFRREYLDPLSDDRFFAMDKTVCFTSAKRWISYLSENVDFSIGTRLHGNVAAVLGGVPAFIVATDQRVEELANYHNIAHTTTAKLNAKTTISGLTKNVDFNRVLEGHDVRFNHFVDFLEKNNLETAYSKDRNVSEVYFDKVQSKLQYSSDVLGFEALSDAQKIIRTQDAAVYYATALKNLQEASKEKDKKIGKMRKMLKKISL